MTDAEDIYRLRALLETGRNSMKPGLIADFRAWAADAPASPFLLVVDPGATTGVCMVDSNHYGLLSLSLEELPEALSSTVFLADAVICEDFSVQPGRHGDAKVPSAVGIGMVWGECAANGVPMFLFQPNMKKSGRARLDQAGLDARAKARDEHQRDVIDLAGKALHELRKAQDNA